MYQKWIKKELFDTAWYSYANAMEMNDFIKLYIEADEDVKDQIVAILEDRQPLPEFPE